jgi:hypothetical protein
LGVAIDIKETVRVDFRVHAGLRLVAVAVEGGEGLGLGFAGGRKRRQEPKGGHGCREK